MVCGAMKVDGTPCQRRGKCPWHQECSVCLAGVRGEGTTLECGHKFHTPCIDRWKSTGHRTCPLCRFEFVKPQYRVVLTVSRVEDGASGTTRGILTDTVTEVFHRMFQLDAEAMSDPNIFTDIHFDVENRTTLDSVLRDLGLELPFLRP
jgi:hypothetical protein